ncbi:hypothetical protein [Streptomyces sp. NPDC018347]|uniref:hypothetical protein n=1 Tax=Streptomyces sp. NPDC018347 TaxID=3157193 RepID=UPI0033EB28F6
MVAGPLADARERFREDLAALPGPALASKTPNRLLPVWSEALARLTASVRAGFGTRLRPAGRVTPPDTAVSHSVPFSARTR